MKELSPAEVMNIIHETIKDHFDYVSVEQVGNKYYIDADDIVGLYTAETITDEEKSYTDIIMWETQNEADKETIYRHHH